jgi:hypothetical protein
MGALSADGQATPMPQATIGPDIHQPFNVHLNAFAKIAFDLALRVNNASNSTQFVFAQITDSSFLVHLSLKKDPIRARTSNSVNVRESNLRTLVRRKVYTCYTSHSLVFSKLNEPDYPD